MSKFYLYFVVAAVAFAGCKKEKTGTTTAPPVAEANISSLNCASAQISSVAIAAASYSATVIVPYVGGNGHSYSAGQAIGSTGVPGLTAMLQPGTARDTGSLIYNISGTPLTSGIANFAISFGNQYCSFIVPVKAVNTAPKAFTADNIFVLLPADSCILSGSGEDPEKDILNFTWRKVSGPPGEVIENPNSSSTIVMALQSGEYAFELTATDPYGLKGSDTVNVYVFKPGQNEVVFKNLSWMCPMGCSVSINNLNSYVPAGKPFLVFLRENTSTQWQYVKPQSQSVSTDKYVYSIYNDTLWVYFGGDISGNVDLKIQY